jgi:hypothetical protein
MHRYHSQTPTCELRWNTHGNRTSPVLEQKWNCYEGPKYWSEWRPVPTVEEAPGIKPPVSMSTMG